ncbi:MAG: hypothetical protein KC910_28975 [Candidatus Eremiobacteraeota bacterium]|nr:hypothetical protein [Candidatus Eremiobacteraeota bacterium]
MKSPPFLTVFGLFLALDVVGILSIPFLIGIDPNLVVMVLLGLLYLVPALAGLSGPNALTWMKEQAGDTGAGLSRLIAGSSLVFLICSVLVRVLDGQHGLALALFYIYCLILCLRLAPGAIVNVALAAPLTFMGKSKRARLAAGVAGVSSGLGLWLVREIFASNTSEQYLIMALLVALSFGYGLTWGGAVSWLASRIRPRG